MNRGQNITRRSFVKSAAGALSVPFAVSSAALGAGARLSASNRITVGFIGVGKQARWHLGTFLNYGDVQVVAVCEVDKTRREHAQKKVIEKHKSCDAYVDFRKVTSRDDIDAVLIGTPDHWHTIPILEACKAKKDIYCEKPLTLTIAEAERAIKAVRKYNVVFQTGSQQRSSRQFRRACELVRSGRIGTIQKVYANVGGPSRWCDLPKEKMEPGLDWDRWLGPAPKRPYNSILSPRGLHNHFPAWRHYREYSGGGMTDWGAHHFDIAQWGLGMDKSGPVKIIPPDNPKAGRGVVYVYDNGVKLIHGPAPKKNYGVTFVGTKGTIYVDRGRIESEPESILKEKLGDDDVHLYESRDHRRNWIECIGTRRRPICDVEIGARSVTICHLGNLAYWHGRTLQWDPGKWRFKGDDEANTWLDRKRRDPWQLPKV